MSETDLYKLMRGADPVWRLFTVNTVRFAQMVFTFVSFFVTVFSGWRWICYRFASGTRSTTNWIQRVTGTKMAPSKKSNSLRCSFTFQKTKKMFTSAYLSSVLFYLIFFLHFSSMKTQRVNYESCSYSVCASFVVATRRRYWRRFVSSRAFEDRRWWSVCVWIFSDEVKVSTWYWKVGFVHPN